MTMWKTKLAALLMICLLHGTGLGLTEEEAVRVIQEAVGKDNPFERVVIETPTTETATPQTPPAAVPLPQPRTPLVMRTVMLKFLNAENIREVVARMNSPFGTVAVDPQTNSLVICDEQEVLERIVSEIRGADQTPQQILIEVLIIDVKLGDQDEIGVNWNNLLGGAEEGGVDSDQVLVGNFPTGLALSVIKDDVTATLLALRQQRDVEILASPRVLVISGQEAEIKTVEEIPYLEVVQTAEGGEMTQTEFKEVGVTLLVRARVTDEGKIQLAVQPRQSVQTGESISEVPVVDTREARTMLLVDDGQMIVIGGLRRKEVRLSTDKVPLLGDLPLLGVLFSREKREIMNSELVVLLQPHLQNGYAPTPRQRELFDEMGDRPMLEISPQKTNLKNAYGPVDAAVEAAGNALGIHPQTDRGPLD